MSKPRHVRWNGYVLYIVEMRKPEGKRALWRARYRLNGNVKKDLKDVGCQDVYWILAHDGLM